MSFLCTQYTAKLSRGYTERHAEEYKLHEEVIDDENQVVLGPKPCIHQRFQNHFKVSSRIREG